MVVDSVTNLGKFFCAEIHMTGDQGWSTTSGPQANLVATMRPLSLPNTVLQRTKGDALRFFYVLWLLSSL